MSVAYRDVNLLHLRILWPINVINNNNNNFVFFQKSIIIWKKIDFFNYRISALLSRYAVGYYDVSCATRCLCSDVTSAAGRQSLNLYSLLCTHELTATAREARCLAWCNTKATTNRHGHSQTYTCIPLSELLVSCNVSSVCPSSLNRMGWRNIKFKWLKWTRTWQTWTDLMYAYSLAFQV